jgi:hypothetical protein
LCSQRCSTSIGTQKGSQRVEICREKVEHLLLLLLPRLLLLLEGKVCAC